jgi:hypothetical protein
MKLKKYVELVETATYTCSNTLNSEGILMRQVSFTKYAFRIKTRLGLVVSNLQIHGKDELEAQKKLRQVYPRCEIIDCVCTRGNLNSPGVMSGSVR